MKQSHGLVLVGIAASLSLGTGCAKVQARGPLPGADPSRDVALTIFSDGFAQVHESRKFDFQTGRNRIAFPLISKRFDSQSMIFDKANGDSTVVSTTYDTGISTQDSLIKRLAGTEVEVVLTSQDGKMGERIKGILESRDGSGYVLRTPTQVYVNPPGTIVVPASAGLSTMQGLNAEIESKSGGSRPVGFSYLTAGMSWSADYVARLSPTGDSLDLECWATIRNETSVAFPDAQLSLVAGQPNRAVNEEAGRTQNAFKSDTSNVAGNVSAPATAYYRESARSGEQHAFDVPSRATILPDQVNRVRLLQATSVKCQKEYRLFVPTGYNHEKQVLPVQTFITAKNSPSSGLGLPLATGDVRVLENEKYVGAATLPNTMKDAPIELEIGKVFDIRVQAKTIVDRKISKTQREYIQEVTIQNSKDRPASLSISASVGRLGSFFDSETVRRIDASTVEAKVTVKAGEKRTIKIRTLA